MPESKAKKSNKGLIIGIVCGAIAIVAIIIVLIVVLANGGTKGKYVLSGMKDKDGNDYSSLISLMGGAKVFIDFKGNGECEMSGEAGGLSFDSEEEDKENETSASDVSKCTYTNDTITSVDNKEEVKYEVDGDKVIVEYDDGKMIFTKE